MVFAGLYKSLSFLSDLFHFHPHRQTQLYVVAPRILQAVFAALGDWGTARLAGRLWGSEIGWVSLLLSMGSAWHWFCGTRTFANSLETVVTAVALSMWPWKWATGEKGGPMQPRGELRLSFLLAAFACVLRPTNLLVWSFLGAFAIWNGVGKRWRLILDAAWIGYVATFLHSLPLRNHA
jgi:phosphatidylinositol glycan class B